MKKIIAMITALLLLGIVGGCKNKSEVTTPIETTAESDIVYETLDFAETASTRETDAAEVEIEEVTEYNGVTEIVESFYKETEPVDDAKTAESNKNPTQATTPVPTQTPSETTGEEWSGGEVEIEF